MSGNVMILPIVPGKVDAWKAFVAQLNGPRAAEFADFNRRYGLTDHRVWHQITPEGDHVAVVLVDGPAVSELMNRLQASEHPFDRWFLDRAVEAHALDLASGPLSPPAEQLISWSG